MASPSRVAEVSNPPDLSETANGPVSDAHTPSNGRPLGEPETCRICRAEGSADEPLFYPCKCSGSIKFVHQECLMEWLSHSQKKHCELCKTPFRFTKLYHSQMPQILPLGVFIRKALLHTLAQLLVWCRGLLVAVVWLVCLPWCMRSAWSFLFWFADAGWARDRKFADEAWAAWLKGLQNRSSNYNSLHASVAKNASEHSRTLSQTVNITSEPPLLYRLWMAFSRDMAHPMHAMNTNYSQAQQDAFNRTDLVPTNITWRPSLLSEVHLLKELMPSPVVHRLVIDVVEGQIITLLVVVAFILIFLIREWVVQQQPVIDMAQADLNNALVQAGGQVQDQHEEEEEGLHDEADSERASDEDSNTTDAEDEGVNIEGVGQASFDIANAQPGDSTTESSNQPSRMAASSSSAIATTAVEEHGLDGQTAEQILRYIYNDVLTKEVRGTLRDRSRADVLTALQKMSKDDMARFRTAYEAFRRARQRENQSTPVADAESSGSRSADDVLALLSSVRPNMPSRNHSSLVAEIKRDLEEFAGRPSSPNRRAEAEAEENSMRDLSLALSNGTTGIRGKERAVEPTDQVFELSLHNDPATDNRAATEIGDPRLGRTHEHLRDTVSNMPHDNTLPLESEPSSSSSLAPESPQIPVSTSEPLFSSTATEAEQKSLGQQVFDWFWGDIEEDELAAPHPDEGEDDAHIVQDVADEPPFVPLVNAQPIHAAPGAAAELDEAGEVEDVEDADQAIVGDRQAPLELNEQDAAEDAEDLEGILELIGMQGPILGLFQNALFSAVLIVASLVAAVFVPYLCGKVVLLCLTMPTLTLWIPLTLATGFAEIILDGIVIAGGTALYTVSMLYNFLFQSNALARLAQSSISRVEAACPRLLIVLNFPLSVADSNDFLQFSIASHSALQRLQDALTERINAGVDGLVKFICLAANDGISSATAAAITGCSASALQLLRQTATYLRPTALSDLVSTIFHTIATPPSFNGYDVKFPLAYWSAADRSFAVVAGYACFATVGAIYLAYFAPVTTIQAYRRVENLIIEFLQQAGGVLKVIFIISIEMIAFPLFCGFLLDLALLPLFDGVTVVSRIQFTARSPWNSAFVHWFVGTCYMFHFALFVSMCRKIMRSGVLYFIRDPDDPTFHPVRDVLERSVTVQLRKIAFSAIVYGALIIVCLGGVVWGLRYCTDCVLPIHWYSSESALEFPLDIILYNMVTPIVVRAARPTDGLHVMYKWWFHKVARLLRLSDFLFKQQHKDEEGHYVFKTWKAWLLRKKGNTGTPLNEKMHEEARADAGVEAYFVYDGKHVRAPASDQVRIPKGNPVFVEVDRNNHRLDGVSDTEGVHSKDSGFITTVYIPPMFKVRIGLFIVAVWVFAAATGIAATVMPLLLGRALIAYVTPTNGNVNDIYAFSLGIYILGGLMYVAVHYRDVKEFFSNAAAPSSNNIADAITTILNRARRAFSVLYVYSALAVGLPCLFAILVELYILIPIHIYFAPEESHIVHVVQDWTLGILYVRIMTQVIQFNAGSRPARAARAVVRDGYLKPSASLATRYFILPVMLFFATMTLVPWLGALLVNATVAARASRAMQIRITRLAYPLALTAVSSVWTFLVLRRATERWRMRIKDEVYLIGERLHNFGERRVARPATASSSSHNA